MRKKGILCFCTCCKISVSWGPLRENWSYPFMIMPLVPSIFFFFCTLCKTFSLRAPASLVCWFLSLFWSIFLLYCLFSEFNRSEGVGHRQGLSLGLAFVFYLVNCSIRWQYDPTVNRSRSVHELRRSINQEKDFTVHARNPIFVAGCVFVGDICHYFLAS